MLADSEVLKRFIDNDDERQLVQSTLVGLYSLGVVSTYD